MRLLFGRVVKRGWWHANVEPSLTPQQVLELLERDADWHPAIPRIRTIVKGWLASRGRRDEYRCGRCMDAQWVEREDKRWVRCPGVKGPCRMIAFRLSEVRERAAEAKSNAVSGEGASL